MADTFSNPYTMESPLGSALKNLSGALLKSKDNEATNAAHAEIALKNKQERENKAALGDALRQLGTSTFDRRAAIDYATRAGVSPENVGGFERYNSANQYGAADQRTTNAVIGAGGSYGSTAAGVREGFANTNRNADRTLAENAREANQTLAENARQFDKKPYVYGTDTGPIVGTQQTAIGQPAVEDLGKVKGNAARVALNAPGGIESATPTTKQFIGAEGKGQSTPHNYVAPGGANLITYDGVNDAATGKPLPPGGYLANAQGSATDVGLQKSVTGDLQRQDIEGQKFKGMLNFTRHLAQSDPNNFGISGIVKGAVQDANLAGANIARGLGYNGLNDAVAAARQKALASGVDPGLISGVFDPKLPALHTAADLLTFQAASALAGQRGQGVSDRDIKVFKSIVGDPNELFSNQQKFLSKLDTIEHILEINQGVIDNNLRHSAPPSAAPPAAPGPAMPPTAGPGAPPQQSAPQGDPLAQARDAIARGADRNAVMQRLQQNGINPAGL